MNKNYLMVALAITLFTGCGSSSSTDKKNDGKGAIDLAEYFPSKSMTKTIIPIKNDKTLPHYDEIINVTDNKTITTTINTKLTEKIIISDTNITTTDFENNETYTTYRHADIGDTVFSNKEKKTENNDLGKVTYDFNLNCKIKSKETKFEKQHKVYEGDLLKIECVNEGTIVYDIKPSLMSVSKDLKDLNGSHPVYNTSYSYLKKGLGEVASIDDDCIPNETLSDIVDDRKSGEECKKQNVYEYEFYIP